jgi:hypothetical protein
MNGEEVVIAKRKKDGWSTGLTAGFINSFQDNEFPGDIFDDLNSEETEIAFEAQDVLRELLIRADVNATAREIIWEDGQRLSLGDSIKRSHRECPQYPFEIVQRQFIVWLEDFDPEFDSQAQWDEYEAISEQWLDDYAQEFGLFR